MALKVIITLHVTNCVGERSFSALAIIKNKPRSSMSQVKLNSLALLSIESAFVKTIDIDILEDFTTRIRHGSQSLLELLFHKSVFF